MPRSRKSAALEKTESAVPAESGESRTLRALTDLMAEISRCRADLARRENLVSDLQRKLTAELRPLEEKILEVRLETFRALGAHLRSGRLTRRAHHALESALYALADALEREYGVDLREDRARIFAEEFPPDREEDSPFEAGEDRYEGADPYGEDAGPYEYRESDFSARGPGGGGKGGPGRSAGSDAKRKPDSRDEAIAGDIRALYLMLARALHPDKESDPSRLAEKTAWMQKVTAAYADRDLARLLDILAANPLDAVGPYLSQAPLKTVQGFAKRLRRELDALRTRLADMDWKLDPFLASLIKGGRLNEAAYNAHMAAVRKELKFLKQRRDAYRTGEGVRQLAEALRKHPWQELL